MQADLSAKRRSLKEKIVSSVEGAAKVAMLLAMLVGPLKEAKASSEGGSEKPVDTKHNIELAQAALMKINEAMPKTDGKETRTLNGREIKTLKLASGQEVVVAKDGKYVILMTNDGEKSFYDDNSNGSLDRIVINNKDRHGLVDNGLYIFQDGDQLASEAEVVWSVEPEPVKVVIFNEDETASYIDMSDGSSGTINGDRAKKMSEKMQSIYTSQLEEISYNLSK